MRMTVAEKAVCACDGRSIFRPRTHRDDAARAEAGRAVSGRGGTLGKDSVTAFDSNGEPLGRR